MVLTCLGSKDSCSPSVAFEVLTRVEMLFKKKKDNNNKSRNAGICKIGTHGKMGSNEGILKS